MIIAPHCCCDPPPEFLERKLLAFTKPFPGEGEFYDSGGGSILQRNTNAYLKTKYLVKETISQGADGITRTVTLTYDAANGSTNTTTNTNPGYTGPSGQRHEQIMVSNTHYRETYWAQFAPGQPYTGQIDIYLSAPIDYEDDVNEWRTVFDSLVPNTALKAPTSFTLYSIPNAAMRTVTIDFPSEIDGAGDPDRYDTIAITPSGGYPWNGEFSISILFNSYSTQELASKIYSVPQSFLGLSGGRTTPGDIIPWFVFNGVNWAVRDTREVSFVKTCWAFPEGIGCSVTGFGTRADLLRDIMVSAVDINTGVATTESQGLSLSPGYYGFTGNELIIFQGNQITPEEPIAFTDYATTWNNSPVESTINYLPDPCPP